MTDSTGETIRIYDELNRTISKNVGNIGGEALYKYDILVSDGNDCLTAEVSQDNKGNAVTKVYDKADNQIAKIETVNGVLKGRTDFEYDDLNRLEKVIEPQGRQTVYTFDAAGKGKKEYKARDNKLPL